MPYAVEGWRPAETRQTSLPFWQRKAGGLWLRHLSCVTVTHRPVKRVPRPEKKTGATLRQVAAAAGVSQMTVSRARGGRGRIAEATRRRIAQLAAELGYRPDPQITKLMHHLRARRAGRFQSVLVGLTNRRPDEREAYTRALIEGAQLQASARGYGFEVMPLPAEPDGRAGLQRMLRSRGVEGLLLLPLRSPSDLSEVLDWREFSTVAASASITGPAVPRVIPHHFANTLLLCRTLAARGHRRIGLVIPADHDLRSAHGFTAAVTWHGLNEAPSPIPPLVTRGDFTAALRSWHTRHRPDVIITHELGSARECARILGRRLGGSPPFVLTSLPGGGASGVAGIDERPGAIGAAAVDLLANLVERRLKGLPESPTSTLLTGQLSE